MADDACSCCGSTDDSDAESGRTGARWITESPVLDAELPGELQSILGRFFGTDPVETLGEWVALVSDRTDGGSISIEELCLTDERTDHRATVDGETYHFACFYDAVILAALTEQPVDIRTTSPGGAVIEARATGTASLTVTPGEAVFSFGIDSRVSPPSGSGPSLEDGYAAICPYVKAFPRPAAYERWAGTVPAATVATELAGATAVAAAFVRE